MSRQIAESVERDCLVVVKSTVPVGTNDKVEQFIHDFLERDVKVEVASNPEFLAQGSAVHDTLHAARIIIGTESKEAEALLKKIYEPFGLPIVSVNRRSAEMIKYACNDFLALKISYMNDIANLCELVGADIDAVAEGMSYDARIGANFLKAGIGYGGSCFPKDTKALKYIAHQHGYTLRTVEAAVDVNAEQKTRLYQKASNRMITFPKDTKALKYLANQHGYRLKTVEAAVDVNLAQKTRLYEKACQRMITFQGLKVAVLGLAFKPGTDDLREAPSLDNVELLLKGGARITAYDPVAAVNFEKRYPAGENGRGSIAYVNTPKEALTGANICFVFTEWQEIKEIAPGMFKELMKNPLVYDGRNVFDVQAMKDAGIEYYSIGR